MGEFLGKYRLFLLVSCVTHSDVWESGLYCSQKSRSRQGQPWMGCGGWGGRLAASGRRDTAGGGARKNGLFINKLLLPKTATRAPPSPVLTRA